MGKNLGIILIIGGLVVGGIIVALMTVYRNEGSLTSGAATLGIVLGLLVLSLPQLAFGAFLLLRGREEAAVAETAGKQRQLLGMVKARGQVNIADLALGRRGDRQDTNGGSITSECRSEPVVKLGFTPRNLRESLDDGSFDGAWDTASRSPLRKAPSPSPAEKVQPSAGA